MSDDDKKLVFRIAIGVFILILLSLVITPLYGLYSKKLSGQALLLEAESSRQIRVAEAQAKFDAAVLEAQAEVERAKGQDAANALLKANLTPELLQYQFLRVLEEQGNDAGERTIIYVPTNSETGVPIGLPLPEAARLQPSAK